MHQVLQASRDVSRRFAAAAGMSEEERVEAILAIHGCAGDVGRASKVGEHRLNYLLTPKQRERLSHHVQVSREAIWDLTQSVRFAARPSKKVPTLRRGSTRLWCHAKKRWLLRIELRAAMGYPVFQDLADVANVPRESAEMMGPVYATGNAMHVANVGCIILLAWLYVD